ncbi:hypothetical protein HDU81_007975 [Chytriomyces hyalinus]|nr:hypothetical protein HDU81_007975 [Chytriomyces hyalinus]
MSRHELLNELVALEEQDTASRLDFAARKRIVIEKLRALGERDVQGGSLDIAPVPVAVSKHEFAQVDSSDCQIVENGELLSRLESQETLMGDETVVETDGLVAITATDEDVKEDATGPSSNTGRFLYCLYTDPAVIEAEAPWRRTYEPADVCSYGANDPADIDEFPSALDTPHGSHEEDAAPVTNVGPEELLLATSTMTEQYTYWSYSDATVIAAEVAWLTAQDSAMQCSDLHLELVGLDGVCESHKSIQVVPASNGTSVTSGSSTKTKSKKVYRPPAKGVSRHLSQDEVNRISLQHRVKK